ncbi:DUF6882 domain-containing protein [Corynebacterium kozikiae]|uniref:DUF6882 domain-containing protein n=1 Tax=Corynebacterium kozikiae TaxID=2968469 RepID=UPI00211D07EF|nr:DUF6882 domain-containing protein [Corynebacterium sp. 76QC2CO]MCQ9344146.1 hypothetical protein [Corynebacterium sp. 76QC2CO]
MDVSDPTQLKDVLTDGFFHQIEKSWAFQHNLGQIENVRFNPVGGTPNYEIIADSAAGPVGFRGIVVAHCTHNSWTWAHNNQTWNIPELSGTHPFHPDLVAAARTLHGNGPVFQVPITDPTPEGTEHEAFHVVVMVGDALALTPRAAITLGLGQLPKDLDLERALTSYAAARGLAVAKGNLDKGANGGAIEATPEQAAHQIADSAHLFHLRDQKGTITTVNLQTQQLVSAITTAEVASDAFYLAHEHKLFAEATFGAQDWQQGVGDVSLTHSMVRVGEHELQALLLAVDGTWSWFHPGFSQFPAAKLARGALDFALEHGLKEFTTPQTSPLAVSAAKSILQAWILWSGPIGEHQGTFLLRSPSLQLPPLTSEVMQAVERTPVPEGIDAARAWRFYMQSRGGGVEAGASIPGSSA